MMSSHGNSYHLLKLLHEVNHRSRETNDADETDKENMTALEAFIAESEKAELLYQDVQDILSKYRYASKFLPGKNSSGNYYLFHSYGSNFANSKN